MKNTSYIIQPPNYPLFFYKMYPQKLIGELILWAQREHEARLRYCAERGYFKELKRLNEDYSFIRVLSEIDGYVRICAALGNRGWDRLTGRQRVYIRRAYEIKNMLRHH